MRQQARRRRLRAGVAGHLILLPMLLLVACGQVGTAATLPTAPTAPAAATSATSATTAATATTATTATTPPTPAEASEPMTPAIATNAPLPLPTIVTIPPTATPTATPVATVTPTSTATATAAATNTLTPTPDPAYVVNGIPIEHFVVIPPETRQNVTRIFAHGQRLGRNPHAFSKVGDSISLTSHYFARFDQGKYKLGIYERLEPTIAYYQDSFERFGVALRIGLHAWIAFRPGLADGQKCNPDEHMVACEIRLNNPSVLLIRLGTNDTAAGDAYERAIRHAIEYSIHEGIVPILVTKSDRFEGDNRHNDTMRMLAAEYAVPLWDFDLVAATLPDRGLGGDNVHLTMYGVNDYTDPATLRFGYPLSDLTGLMMLDTIRQIVTEGEAE